MDKSTISPKPSTTGAPSSADLRAQQNLDRNRRREARAAYEEHLAASRAANDEADAAAEEAAAHLLAQTIESEQAALNATVEDAGADATTDQDVDPEDAKLEVEMAALQTKLTARKAARAQIRMGETRGESSTPRSGDIEELEAMPRIRSPPLRDDYHERLDTKFAEASHIPGTDSLSNSTVGEEKSPTTIRSGDAVRQVDGLAVGSLRSRAYHDPLVMVRSNEIVDEAEQPHPDPPVIGSARRVTRASTAQAIARRTVVPPPDRPVVGVGQPPVGLPAPSLHAQSVGAGVPYGDHSDGDLSIGTMPIGPVSSPLVTSSTSPLITSHGMRSKGGGSSPPMGSIPLPTSAPRAHGQRGSTRSAQNGGIDPLGRSTAPDLLTGARASEQVSERTTESASCAPVPSAAGGPVGPTTYPVVPLGVSEGPAGASSTLRRTTTYPVEPSMGASSNLRRTTTYPVVPLGVSEGPAGSSSTLRRSTAPLSSSTPLDAATLRDPSSTPLDAAASQDPSSVMGFRPPSAPPSSTNGGGGGGGGGFVLEQEHIAKRALQKVRHYHGIEDADGEITFGGSAPDSSSTTESESDEDVRDMLAALHGSPIGSDMMAGELEDSYEASETGAEVDDKSVVEHHAPSDGPVDPIVVSILRQAEADASLYSKWRNVPPAWWTQREHDHAKVHKGVYHPDGWLTWLNGPDDDTKLLGSMSPSSNDEIRMYGDQDGRIWGDMPPSAHHKGRNILIVFSEKEYKHAHIEMNSYGVHPLGSVWLFQAFDPESIKSHPKIRTLPEPRRISAIGSLNARKFYDSKMYDEWNDHQSYERARASYESRGNGSADDDTDDELKEDPETREKRHARERRLRESQAAVARMAQEADEQTARQTVEVTRAAQEADAYYLAEVARMAKESDALTARQAEMDRAAKVHQETISFLTEQLQRSQAQALQRLHDDESLAREVARENVNMEEISPRATAEQIDAWAEKLQHRDFETHERSKGLEHVEVNISDEKPTHKSTLPTETTDGLSAEPPAAPQSGAAADPDGDPEPSDDESDNGTSSTTPTPSDTSTVTMDSRTPSPDPRVGLPDPAVEYLAQVAREADARHALQQETISLLTEQLRMSRSAADDQPLSASAKHTHDSRFELSAKKLLKSTKTNEQKTDAVHKHLLSSQNRGTTGKNHYRKTTDVEDAKLFRTLCPSDSISPNVAVLQSFDAFNTLRNVTPAHQGHLTDMPSPTDLIAGSVNEQATKGYGDNENDLPTIVPDMFSDKSPLYISTHEKFQVARSTIADGDKLVDTEKAVYENSYLFKAHDRNTAEMLRGVITKVHDHTKSNPDDFTPLQIIRVNKANDAAKVITDAAKARTPGSPPFYMLGDTVDMVTTMRLGIQYYARTMWALIKHYICPDQLANPTDGFNQLHRLLSSVCLFPNDVGVVELTSTMKDSIVGILTDDPAQKGVLSNSRLLQDAYENFVMHHITSQERLDTLHLKESIVDPVAEVIENLVVSSTDDAVPYVVTQVDLLSLRCLKDQKDKGIPIPPHLEAWLTEFEQKYPKSLLTISYMHDLAVKLTEEHKSTVSGKKSPKEDRPHLPLPMDGRRQRRIAMVSQVYKPSAKQGSGASTRHMKGEVQNPESTGPFSENHADKVRAEAFKKFSTMTPVELYNKAPNVDKGIKSKYFETQDGTLKKTIVGSPVVKHEVFRNERDADKENGTSTRLVLNPKCDPATWWWIYFCRKYSKPNYFKNEANIAFEMDQNPDLSNESGAMEVVTKSQYKALATTAKAPDPDDAAVAAAATKLSKGKKKKEKAKQKKVKQEAAAAEEPSTETAADIKARAESKADEEFTYAAAHADRLAEHESKRKADCEKSGEPYVALVTQEGL
jgi:hypothetical protein